MTVTEPATRGGADDDDGAAVGGSVQRSVYALQWQSILASESDQCSIPTTSPSTAKVGIVLVQPLSSTAVPPHASQQVQQQLKAKQEAQGGEGVPDNRSFLQRNWHYILMFMLGFSVLQAIVAPPPQQGGAGGGGGRPAS
eukprot:PhF_6_TR30421/c0_g1_i3/m.44627